MKKFIFIITVVILLASCSCQNWLGKDIETTNRMPIESKNTENSELTILYPYAYQLNEYERVFNELNALSKDVLGVTVRMITFDEEKIKPGDVMMHTQFPLYTITLESSMNAGLGPDIFVVTGTYGISKTIKNDLHYAVQSGYVADITEYINSETPYITRLVQEYPNMLPFMSVQDRIYGIITPVTYTYNLVFFVHNAISRQLDNRDIHTFQDALNACIEINHKNLLGPQDQIHFNYYTYLLNHIIQEAGYDEAFSDSILYMYYVKQNDETNKIYRIEETSILESIFNYRDLFERYSIDTKEIDKEKRLIAGVTAYKDILTEKYNFNKDKLEYDVYFLDGINNILTGQGSPDQHNMFVVSETCNDKQTAVRYINWLYSDIEANKLIKYGIEGVHYKIDFTGLLYVDETVTGLNQSHSLFSGHTVDTGIMSPESIYITEPEDTITHRILSNYRIDTFTKLILNSLTIDESGDFTSIANKYLALTDRMDFNTWRYNERELSRILMDLLDYAYDASYLEVYNKLAGSRNNKFINELQSIVGKEGEQ